MSDIKKEVELDRTMQMTARSQVKLKLQEDLKIEEVKI